VAAEPDNGKKRRYAELKRRLGAGRVQEGIPLAPFTTFRIGGPTDLFFQAQTGDDLTESLLAARELGIPLFLLGHGANILVADAGFRGLVVQCQVGGTEFLGEGRVRVGSGVTVFPDLIDRTVAAGLGGLHHFVGIPGTVGGAMWQNLHFLSPAPARERTVFLEEVVAGAEILTEEGHRIQVDADYFRFGYDFSVLHERDDAVLNVTFDLESQPTAELETVMDENLAWRRGRHPDLTALPSAGSIFKKVEGVGAGRLIDECGLKGLQDGGAQIFSRHANIIVNRGGASASEVLRLMEKAVTTVDRETGHRLVPEISLIGDFEEDLSWIPQDTHPKTV
jgi:UDP-N-acetylmuramate dehydrogenase